MEVSRSDAFARTMRISRRGIGVYYVFIFTFAFGTRSTRGREFAPEVVPSPAGVSTRKVYPTNYSSSLRDPGQLNRSGTLDSNMYFHIRHFFCRFKFKLSGLLVEN